MILTFAGITLNFRACGRRRKQRRLPLYRRVQRQEVGWTRPCWSRPAAGEGGVRVGAVSRRRRRTVGIEDIIVCVVFNICFYTMSSLSIVFIPCPDRRSSCIASCVWAGCRQRVRARTTCGACEGRWWWWWSEQRCRTCCVIIYKSSTPIGRCPSSERFASDAVGAVVEAAEHTLIRCKQERRGAAGALPRPTPARGA